MIDYVFHPGDQSDFDLPGAMRIGEAEVPAALYDNGGHPAVAHGMPGRVAGTLYWIGPSSIEETFQMLDGLHHAIGPGYMRTIVMATPTTGIPVAAIAWNWTGPIDMPHVVGGDWNDETRTKMEKP